MTRCATAFSACRAITAKTSSSPGRTWTTRRALIRSSSPASPPCGPARARWMRPSSPGKSSVFRRRSATTSTPRLASPRCMMCSKPRRTTPPSSRCSRILTGCWACGCSKRRSESGRRMRRRPLRPTARRGSASPAKGIRRWMRWCSSARRPKKRRISPAPMPCANS